MNRHQPNKNSYTLRSGLTLYPEQDKAINQALSDLMVKIPANFTILTDVTGQVIAAKGQKNGLDLVALGSLIAGDLAASQEIARLTGEYQDNQLVLREGQHTHTFVLEAGHYLALLVQVSHEVPLGWARMVIKQGTQGLAVIVEQAQAQNDQVAAVSGPLFTEDNLPDLFSEALDDLWQE